MQILASLWVSSASRREDLPRSARFAHPTSSHALAAPHAPAVPPGPGSEPVSVRFLSRVVCLPARTGGWRTPAGHVFVALIERPCHSSRRFRSTSQASAFLATALMLLPPSSTRSRHVAAQAGLGANARLHQLAVMFGASAQPAHAQRDPDAAGLAPSPPAQGKWERS